MTVKEPPTFNRKIKKLCANKEIPFIFITLILYFLTKSILTFYLLTNRKTVKVVRFD